MNHSRNCGKSLAVLSVVFALLGAALALWQVESAILLVILRMLAFGCALLAVAFVTLWLKPFGREINMKNFDESISEKNPVPYPPAMPVGLAAYDACMGSLRGALRAIDQFEAGFSVPLQKWQLERCTRALKDISEACEAGADVQLVVNFATQYLPSAMQYLAACAAEGCPANSEHTLAAMACACEKQVDALGSGSAADFKAEYLAIRNSLEIADFSWAG